MPQTWSRLTSLGLVAVWLAAAAGAAGPPDAHASADVMSLFRHPSSASDAGPETASARATVMRTTTARASGTGVATGALPAGARRPPLAASRVERGVASSGAADEPLVADDGAPRGAAPATAGRARWPTAPTRPPPAGAVGRLELPDDAHRGAVLTDDGARFASPSLFSRSRRPADGAGLRTALRAAAGVSDRVVAEAERAFEEESDEANVGSVGGPKARSSSSTDGAGRGSADLEARVASLNAQLAEAQAEIEQAQRAIAVLSARGDEPAAAAAEEARVAADDLSATLEVEPSARRPSASLAGPKPTPPRRPRDMDDALRTDMVALYTPARNGPEDDSYQMKNAPENALRALNYMRELDEYKRARKEWVAARRSGGGRAVDEADDSGERVTAQLTPLDDTQLDDDFIAHTRNVDDSTVGDDDDDDADGGGGGEVNDVDALSVEEDESLLQDADDDPDNEIGDGSDLSADEAVTRASPPPASRPSFFASLVAGTPPPPLPRAAAPAAATASAAFDFLFANRTLVGALDTRLWQRVQTSCRRLLSLGAKLDGGWRVCADPLNAASRVASFGFGVNLSFERDLAAALGIVEAGQLFAFDPTPLAKHWADTQLRLRAANPLSVDLQLPHTITYKALTLADVDGDVDFYKYHGSPHYVGFEHAWGQLESRVRLPAARLGSVLDALGVRRLSVLKLDLEGGEWRALRDVLASPELPFDQLLIQLHYFDFEQADEVEGAEGDEEAVPRSRVASALVAHMNARGLRLFHVGRLRTFGGARHGVIDLGFIRVVPS